MSTVEDFKNAPFGATATHDSGNGSRALKTDKIGLSWILQNERYLSDEEMERQGFTLDVPAPATAREALDLAWEVAHPVKEGQVIPSGTRYLRLRDGEIHAYTAMLNFKINAKVVPVVRTVEPLLGPVPYWIDAPAVIAHTDNDHTRRVWAARTEDQWASTGHTYTRKWRDLRDVTPLYPKETEE